MKQQFKTFRNLYSWIVINQFFFLRLVIDLMPHVPTLHDLDFCLTSIISSAWPVIIKTGCRTPLLLSLDDWMHVQFSYFPINLPCSGTVIDYFRPHASRVGICHSRHSSHSRRQCKNFASGVNFSRNNAIYNRNESTKYILY